MQPYTNQAVKSLRDFLRLFPKLVWNSDPKLTEFPQPRLVLRVATAGHIHISSPASLQHALYEILSGLKDYVWRVNERFSRSFYSDFQTVITVQPELRILCQLAPGVDQMVASSALELGYSLHAVLPGNRVAFEYDIQRQSNRVSTLFGSEKVSSRIDGNQIYRDLLRRATQVLELDPPTGPISSNEFTYEAYAQASSVILNHSDIVIITIHDEATAHAGGTKWIEQRAESLDLPVIRIPIDHPSKAILIWTTEGRRESCSLFNAMSQGLNPSIFDLALNEILLCDTTTTPYRSGWFENRVINQIDPAFNSRLWDERWTLPNVATSLAEHSLGNVPKQIDNDLKAVKVWADHRASAMAELVRGSFIYCSLLGSLAVFGAVIGLLVPAMAKTGKVLEVACLVIILCFIWRSSKWNWRFQWLSLRQLERSIDQAAWLLTLGRIPSFIIPAHVREFQSDSHAVWVNWYLRAVLRSASFPTAQLDADYIGAVHNLTLKNLVRNQIRYFESEAGFYHRADELLEKYTNRCIFLAFLVTVAYLITPYVFLLALSFNMPTEMSNALREASIKAPSFAGPVATVVGALMPAIAAALSAIRSQGEYAQIAARYQGISGTLKQLEYQFVRMLPNGKCNRNDQPLRSAEVAELLLAATNSLFQEVVGWQSILRKKKIEPA